VTIVHATQQRFKNGTIQMDLNDLRYFVLAVQHGGFSAAERHSRIIKSKLSRRIALLEERLEVRLLQRDSRRLSLTEAGKIFYESCYAVVMEAEAAEQALDQLRSEPTGLVRLTCPVSMAQLYVARAVADFVRIYPRVTVEIDATDRHVNLIEERFDIAISASNESADPALIKRRIASGRLILTAAPAYLEGRPAIEQPEQLTRFDTIGALRDGPEQVWTLTRVDARLARVSTRPRLLCSDVMTQYQAALGGAGVALLPLRVALRSLQEGALAHVAKDWSMPGLNIHMIYATRRGMLPSVRTLIDHLAQHIPATLAQWPPGG
jgi:DNA-binding transcriptional LysR family regulator